MSARVRSSRRRCHARQIDRRRDALLRRFVPRFVPRSRAQLLDVAWTAGSLSAAFAAIVVVAIAGILAQAPAPARAVGTNAVVTTGGCYANTLPANDDGSTGAQPLGFTVNFFGTQYSSLYVNNNGDVTFDAGFSGYSPLDLGTFGKSIIAVALYDVDTRAPGSSPVTYGPITYNGHPAYCANWVNVGYYLNGGDRNNYFQLILVSRADVEADAFDIVMNYDRMNYPGSNGLTVGYASNTGTYMEIPNSRVPNMLYDGDPTTGLVYGSRNSGVNGRYVYQVRGGHPDMPQNISFPAIGNRGFENGPFEVAATASSGLAVSFSASGNCSVSGTTVTPLAIGSCTITASQAGGPGWVAAPSVPQTFSIVSGQTITFPDPGAKTYGDAPFALSATASSGLAVSYGASGSCTVTSGTVTIHGGGLCSLTASQPGDAFWVAANPVTRTIDVAKAAQTITFPALADATFGDGPRDLAAAASSGLTVAYAASGWCEIQGSRAAVTGAGSCTVTASQAGDTNWLAAAPVDRSFSIARAAQTIAFAALPDRTFGDAAFALSATATSGGSVSFAVNGVCTLTGASLSIDAAGDCTVTASQAGNADWLAAPAVARSFHVAKAPQTIDFAPLAGRTFGDAPFGVVASATSSGTVTFAATGDCSISGATVTIEHAGSCTVTASQAGNADWLAAPDVSRTFAIARSPQSISFDDPGAHAYGDAPFAVHATADSGLPVALAVDGTCSLAGTTVTIAAAGTCTVTGSQAGDDDWLAAPDATLTIAVDQAGQTIAFLGLQDKTYGDAPFAATASASSGLAVTLRAEGGCTVSGSTVTISAAGTCTVTAEQAGDSNYRPAAPVQRTFTIHRGAQTIHLAAGGSLVYAGDPVPFSASADSGLTVSVQASGSCSIVGGNLSPLTAGDCALSASQAGDSNWEPAPDATLVVPVAKAAQSIVFAQPAARTFGDLPFAVSPTAASGLPVTVSASGPCSLAAGSVSISGAGTCTLTASQPGDSNWLAAPQVVRSVLIARAAQTIQLVKPGPMIYAGSPGTVSASATSGLAVTLTGSGACTIANGRVTATAAGTCTIEAAQAGDSNWLPASNAAAVQVAPGRQSIALTTGPGIRFGAGTIAYDATASSGLAVAVTAAGPCRIDSGAIVPTGAGTCSVTAAQAGNANWLAASPVSRSVQIAPGIAHLSFGTLRFVATGAPIVVSVQTDPAGLSGIAVTYDGEATPPAAAGSYTVGATLHNANYEAESITGTLEVAARISPRISFSGLGGTGTVDGSVAPADGTTAGGANGSGTGTDGSGTQGTAGSGQNAPAASRGAGSNGTGGAGGGAAAPTITAVKGAPTTLTLTDLPPGTVVTASVGGHEIQTTVLDDGIAKIVIGSGFGLDTGSYNLDIKVTTNGVTQQVAGVTFVVTADPPAGTGTGANGGTSGGQTASGQKAGGSGEGGIPPVIGLLAAAAALAAMFFFVVVPVRRRRRDAR